jgi:hypothetical protein
MWKYLVGINEKTKFFTDCQNNGEIDLVNKDESAAVIPKSSS